jgi:ATP-binding cassette subfamily B protein
VSFKYRNRAENALTDVSFAVVAGQKVGLVGHSGCGKSTTLQLLLGLYAPTAGEILLDGASLKDFDIHHLRASLGVVSQ